MSLRLRSGVAWVAWAAVVAAVGIGACNKTASPPGGFGVNVTVDATAISPANRMKIKGATLRALSDKAGAAVVTSTIKDFVDAVQGGTVRFHYTPATSVKAGERLTIGIDALGTSSVIVASGSKQSPALKDMAAVDLTITLEGPGDGGAPPDGGETDGGGSEGGGKKSNGTACVEGGECNSGICADTVCCDTKCDDVCVSCNLTATKGTCTPYAVDTDPEMECTGAVSEPDGGTPAPAPDGSAATGDGSSASADAESSDAASLNAPDGGFMTTPGACAGKCSGAKSCKFPGDKKACGQAFCNSRRDVGSFVCDGTGGCSVSLAPCSDYACEEGKGACRTTCSAHLECLLGDYCDQHKCVPKNANGIKCTTPEECASGFCASGVCCNTSCGEPGLSCNPGGGVPAGKCQCPGVTCGAGVACQVFYRDSDGDTFGDAGGTIALGTAKPGCAGAAPPVGFVADNTDCDDGDAQAHPGQTNYFAVPTSGKKTFDYNCSGPMPEKETPEYPGGSCRFCGAPGSCTTPSMTSCTAAGAYGSFQCPQEGFVIISPPIIMPAASGAATTLTPVQPAQVSAPLSVDQPIEPLIILPPKSCCGCAVNDKTGFLSAIECGKTGTTYTCTCAAASGNTAPGMPTAKVQRCR